ncbi:MAG: hypothetical protein KME06_17660 [Kastovskya adunca ATA6-11-RM4]|jgi:hypothetical protein|nr:hypothetical protein [Kastovskya adunca ATA6-11-RM4]
MSNFLRNFSLGSLAVFNLLFLTYVVKQPVLSSSNTPENLSTPISNEVLTIEGEIITVMGIFPPQIVVQTESGRYYVTVPRSTTIIAKGGKKVSLTSGDLDKARRVKISGLSTNSHGWAITAKKIKVVSRIERIRIGDWQQGV